MLKIHPRGFYGSNNTSVMTQTLPMEYFTTKPNESTVVREYDANKAIFDIFHKHENNDIDLTDFDEMAEIVATVVKAFGLVDFGDWYKMQFQSPYFGDMHVDFIEDLAKYIITGTREMGVYTWGAILDRSPDKANPNRSLKTYTAQLVSDKGLRNNEPSSSITNIAARMLQYPDGFDNLILTAYILFCIKC